MAFFSDVQLAALMTHDPEGADEFITQVLGDFESASAELRAAMLTFVNEQCNASRAAERLHTHRSTLLRRLARANALLPRPLDKTSVRLAVALEALRWRGNHSNSAR